MAPFLRVSTFLTLVLCLSLMTVSANADEQTLSAKTNVMPVLSLKDQFDKTQNIDQSTKIVIFAHDMDGNDIVEEALASYDADKLTAMNTVFLADISGMPSLIGKLFALPAMRKRAYPIMLDREGKLVEGFKVKEEQVTVMFLDNLAITDTKLVKTGSELSTLLESASK